MLIDTHTHIQFKGFDKDREIVLEKCSKKELIMNVIGTQKNTSKLAVDLAEKHDNIYATIGTHPVHLFSTHIDEEESSFVSREEDFDEEYYNELVKSEKVIGVGETGLDLYHLPKDQSKEEVLEKQKQVFLAHIDFAQKHNIPLVIHCRNAHDEMIELLQSLNKKIKGVMHCFSGNWLEAQKYLDIGLYLGFTGVVTFPPKKTDPKPQNDLLEVIEKTPLDRILSETDSPYLAPQKYRGKKCEPWMVEEVVEKIAEIKGISFEKCNESVIINALKLFSKIVIN
jgi:TatD DNase family protein